MNEQPTTITVIGCGYVGVTTAAILSHCGYMVYAIEVNPERLNILKQGRSFFYEVGIDPLIAHSTQRGSLVFTDNYTEALSKSSVVFSCVGTPDNPDGSSNLSYVFTAAKQAAEHIAQDAIFVQKSTVPVGTGQKVERIFKDAGATISYVSNPEFLRESTAVIDTLWFDRIIAGSNDTSAAERILDIYRVVEKQRDTIASLAKLETPENPPATQYIHTTQSSAELIKVSANAFLALKISFANSIAKLADAAGANVVEVMEAVGADRRIGRAFLNAGRGYGGGCFPKDVSGLIRSAQDFGVSMEIMQAADDVNNAMPGYILTKAQTILPQKSWKDVECTVLGLAFKSGTSDTRKSPAIAIANLLRRNGARVKAYDPQAIEEATHDLSPEIELCTDLAVSLQNSSCVCIATDWSEFQNIDWAKTNVQYVIDAMNCLEPASLPNNITYIGIGR